MKAIAIGDASTLNSAIVSLKITKASSGGGSGWVDTPLASIPSGSQIVVVSEKSGAYYAMTNDKGTGAAPAASAITVTNGTIAEPDDNLIWTLTVIEGTPTTYKFGTGDNFLYCTNTNNGVRVGSNTNNVFHVDENGYLVNDGQNRWVGVYNNADWRCYTSLHTNIAGQTFHYFVKQ